MPETVFVGMSGGVDSSVAAKRLIELGYRVVGVFIKVWQPDFIVCEWEKERLDAMRVAAHLGIPFLTFNAEETYKKEVADYMIHAYEAGYTPNPDVMCNEHVKFGSFFNWARGLGADKIATGHYARTVTKNGVTQLLRGIDTSKDQSYFLWRIPKEVLQYVIFPVGDTLKLDVRKEAEDAGIPTFAKSDSQGVCFLGDIDMKEFLSHFIQLSSGPVLNEAGTQIGTHNGALLYTIGERHGFSVETKKDSNVPQYVIRRNLEENTITVAGEPLMITETVDSFHRCLLSFGIGRRLYLYRWKKRMIKMLYCTLPLLVGLQPP
jgi:tRNA-specific 2-thiouridylase